MGVIRRDLDPRAIVIEDLQAPQYPESDLTESDVESIASSVRIVASRTQKKKEERESRRLRRFHDSVGTDGVNIRKNMGARKCRRVENARFLLSMIDKDDIIDDFSDILQRNETAFDQLFNDSAKMAIWNDFIERDEEDQARLLEEARCITKKEANKPGSWFTVGGRSLHRIKEEHDDDVHVGQGDGESDRRRHHPAYSASSCFARISQKLRAFLSERSLPWPLIDRADRELRDFFIHLPQGGWRRYISNPRDRLTVHAVAAFLMLTSKTVKEDGKEIIEIHNGRAYFIPPHSLLIPYLATKRKSPIEFTREPRWPDDVIDEEDEDDDKTITDGDSTTTDASSLDASFEII